MVKSEEIQRCINILRDGGLIVAPSDTVYGLVCDATNEQAVKKLIAVKNRPIGKPISVFVDGFSMMENLVEVTQHKNLLERLLPGPFTTILPSKRNVCPLLESEKKTLGVRYTSFPWIQELVHKYGKPLTATSANVSGRPPHYEPEGFISELPQARKHLIDHCVDFGKLPRNKPSTIIDLSGSSLHLIRKGEIMLINEEQFTTKTTHETKKTAEYLMQKYEKTMDNKPLVFIIDGEMGAGKTVFAQGMGAYLGTEPIISPTYVIYYEYKTKKKNIKTFLHADLYNIEEKDEFLHLGLEEYLKPNIVLCIEWGNRVGPLFEKIKANSTLIYIKLAYVNETDRTITVQEL